MKPIGKFNENLIALAIGTNLKYKKEKQYFDK